VKTAYRSGAQRALEIYGVTKLSGLKEEWLRGVGLMGSGLVDGVTALPDWARANPRVAAGLVGGATGAGLGATTAPEGEEQARALQLGLAGAGVGAMGMSHHLADKYGGLKETLQEKVVFPVMGKLMQDPVRAEHTMRAIMFAQNNPRLLAGAAGGIAGAGIGAATADEGEGVSGALKGGLIGAGVGAGGMALHQHDTQLATMADRMRKAQKNIRNIRNAMPDYIEPAS
jgi:hypothetical protein